MSTPVPITGLFNTGVDSTGVATAAGTADSHYAVVASPVGSGNAFSVGPNGTFPIPPWAPDLAGPGGYNWISGPLPGPQSEPNGPFDYQTHFTANSTGAISISGMLSGDDQVTQILINGVVATTTGLPTTDQGYSSLYPFTASVASGGILGPNANTLDFIDANTNGSVEGLLVSQIAGTTAGPIVVNTAGDASNDPPGVVSLDAVNLVNGGSPSHDITFAPSLAGATLTLNGSALLLLTSNMTIGVLAGSTPVTIAGDSNGQAFEVAAGQTVAFGAVAISGSLTVDKLRWGPARSL